MPVFHGIVVLLRRPQGRRSVVLRVRARHSTVNALPVFCVYHPRVRTIACFHHNRNMNRTLEDATVNRLFHETHDQLKAHLTFIAASNFARRLKTLQSLTPHQFAIETWSESPKLFHSDPFQLNWRLYT